MMESNSEMDMETVTVIEPCYQLPAQLRHNLNTSYKDDKPLSKTESESEDESEDGELYFTRLRF